MSTGSRVVRRSLSDILVDEGHAPRDAVQEALQIQSTTGETLGAILADMGVISATEVAKIICVHFQLPFVSLRHYDCDTKLAQLFPPEFLHQHKVFPFDSVGDMLLLGVMEIPPEKVLTEIPRIVKRKVAFYVAALDDIDRFLEQTAPLPENSELLQRKRHFAPRAGGRKESGEDSSRIFTDQSSEQLLDALDSTWESIFDEIEGGGPPKLDGESTDDSGEQTEPV